MNDKTLEPVAKEASDLDLDPDDPIKEGLEKKEELDIGEDTFPIR